jgi:hypothetical protein
MSATSRVRPLVLVIFMVVLVLHIAATFAAWSLHPGNMARQPSSPTWFQANGFRVLAAPSSWLLPASAWTEQFWPVLIFNSCVCAGAVAAVLSFAAHRWTGYGQTPESNMGSK